MIFTKNKGGVRAIRAMKYKKYVAGKYTCARAPGQGVRKSNIRVKRWHNKYENIANPVLGKSLCSDSFFLGQDFAVRIISMETVQPVYFCFGAKPANSKFATKQRKKTGNIVILHSETTRRS